MNITGLDYNTHREPLILPEYGREVQKMVDYALTIEDKDRRQRCAESIIATMKRRFPQGKECEGFEQKLWDHLAIMSNFKLDIDYPYDISQAAKIKTAPEPMQYPMQHIKVMHYGKMIFDIFEKLKNMQPGGERDALVKATANQMKRNLVQWGHGSSDNEKVAADLEYFTDGKIKIDLDKFKFEKIKIKEVEKKKKKK